jgi:hypothetical protein
LHPHLELERTMVHVPRIKPGDFVAWHCDSKSTLSPPNIILSFPCTSKTVRTGLC